MTKKETFIDEITKLLQDNPANFLSPDALDYWNGLLASGSTDRPQFTKNGKLILKYIQDNKDNYNNLFKAKEVGEGLSISSRTASGAMRKLVTDGYIEKVGTNPTIYSITSKGLEVNIDNIEE